MDADGSPIRGLLTMKLTRKQLTHAQDQQLAAIGFKRAKHPGWLRKALATEFTPEQINAFALARRKTKDCICTLPYVPNCQCPIHGEAPIIPTEQRIFEEIPKMAAAIRGDRNVESVREKLSARAALGLKKYGVTTERTDLTQLDFLRHAQEEAMDLAVYLERLIQEEGRTDLQKVGDGIMSAMIEGVTGRIRSGELGSPSADSAEAFANDLYEKNGRDLSCQSE